MLLSPQMPSRNVILVFPPSPKSLNVSRRYNCESGCSDIVSRWPLTLKKDLTTPSDEDLEVGKGTALAEKLLGPVREMGAKMEAEKREVSTGQVRA